MGENLIDDKPVADSSSVTNVDDNTQVPASSADTNANAGDDLPTPDQLVDQVLSASKPNADAQLDGSVRLSDGTPADGSQTGKPPGEGIPSEGQQKPAETPAKTDTDKSVEAELPPFHQHPRWQQLQSERNELRIKVQEMEPAYQEFSRYRAFQEAQGVSKEQFESALQIAALINNDPQAALRELKPVMEALGQYDGGSLPPDLSEEVANGDLTEERAMEIAKLRADSKLSSVRQTTAAQRQQAALQQSYAQGIQAWDQSVSAKDPDFKPKARADAPDGKYEMVSYRALALFQQHRPTSPQDAVRLLQQAYDETNKALGRLIPAKPIRHVGATTAVPATTKEPSSPEDVLADVMRRHNL